MSAKPLDSATAPDSGAGPVRPSGRLLPFDAKSQDVKARLIAAAGELFLEKGFERATVREICARAGANVAAVNYHFGDKLGLYKALLFECVEELPVWVGQAEVPPEARLRAFVRERLSSWFLGKRMACGDVLMLREMIEPTPALEEVVRVRLAPAALRLLHLVQDLLGKPRTERENAPETDCLCALSIIGQCLHHFFCKNVVQMLYPDMRYDADSVERLAAHIADFSLAGVRAVGLAEQFKGSSVGQIGELGREGREVQGRGRRGRGAPDLFDEDED